jgi:hypothetical protein
MSTKVGTVRDATGAARDLGAGRLCAKNMVSFCDSYEFRFFPDRIALAQC